MKEQFPPSPISQQEQHLPQVSSCVGHIGDTDVELECFKLAFHRKHLGCWQLQQFTQEPVSSSPLPRDMETADGEVVPPLQGKNQAGLLA